MENNNENEELIQSPGNEENLIPEKKGCIQNKITIFSCVIAIFALSIFGIIFSLSINREPKKENKDTLYELDTIPSEEMERARKSFKQYQYINNSKIINYNFYIHQKIYQKMNLIH